MAVSEVGREAQSIGVDPRWPRPCDKAEIDAVDRVETPGRGRHPVDGAELSGTQSALRGQVAFHICGQAFHMPAGKKRIGKGEGNSSEHASQGTRPASRLVKMDYVGVFVDEQQAQPVVRASDDFCPRRRRHIHENHVARKHGREPVRIVPLVCQHDMGQRRGRQRQRRRHITTHVLDHCRQTPGQLLFTRVRVDDEMGRTPLDELQARVDLGLSQSRRSHQRQRQSPQRDQGAASYDGVHG